MKKRVFITGGAGLIGLTLAKHLISNGHQVVLFDLAEQFSRRNEELSEISSNENLEIVVGTIMDRWAVALAARNCNVVVHLAAMLGVKRTEDNRLQCMDINVNGTDNVLNACTQNDVSHILLASSSEVYGEPSTNPVNEGVETKGKTVYAVSKMAAEELVIGFNQIKPSLKYTIVRFFNTYGEGQVAQFVISKLVRQVLNNQNPTVYGSGSQVRSFCHVSDTVRGLDAIINKPISHNKTYNIGNSEEVYSMTELGKNYLNVKTKFWLNG